MIGKGKGERRDSRRQFMNLKKLYPRKDNITGKCSHKPPAAPMPYAAHFMEQNVLTDNKQTWKVTKQNWCGKKTVFHITSYLWDSPQPPPLSLKIHHLPQASHKRQAQHSPLSRREIQFLLFQEESHSPDRQIDRCAGFVIQIRDSLDFFLAKQVPLASFSVEQVNWKRVTRRPP